MTSISDELLPCPFCGMEVTLERGKDDKITTFKCPPESHCVGSGLGTFALNTHVSAAIAAWNRRTSLEGVREWRPIATAPKDGTRVDLWRQGHRVTDAFWDEGEEWWCIDSRYSDGEPCPLAVSPEPTHWQSLPAPPALSPNKEDEDAA
jgi:hypothetical protein